MSMIRKMLDCLIAEKNQSVYTFMQRVIVTKV